MADEGNFEFSGGLVSGARTSLVDDGRTSVSVTYAMPLAEAVGQAGGYNNTNFQPENTITVPVYLTPFGFPASAF